MEGATTEAETDTRTGEVVAGEEAEIGEESIGGSSSIGATGIEIGIDPDRGTGPDPGSGTGTGGMEVGISRTLQTRATTPTNKDHITTAIKIPQVSSVFVQTHAPAVCNSQAIVKVFYGLSVISEDYLFTLQFLLSLLIQRLN